MASSTTISSTATGYITQDHGSTVEIVVLVLTAFSLASTIALLVSRLCCKYVIPESWRIALVLQDIAYLLLISGLALFLGYVAFGLGNLCSAAGFFLLLGVLDVSCMLVLAVVALLFLQNPGKLGQLSTFRRSKMALLVLPQKVAVFLLALVPVIPMDYFDTQSPYPVACFPVRQEGGKGAAFGAILFFILWVLEILGISLSGVCAFRLWKSSSSRIHASSPNLWQAEKISQGRGLHKILLLEQLFLLAATFALTVVVYTNTSTSASPSSPSWLLTPQWVVMAILAVVASLHGTVSGVQLVLWSSACCCQVGAQRSKEPYQRLKKLELIKVEGPGKLRLKASWSAGKGDSRNGLVKVYGLNQLKGWAQEIVVLGMLRKNQSPSLLQCLWTANTNPYFETMTMLSGQIVTSESRLICLELTSRGTLQEFLNSLDVPLPEPCTRTILHDLAEGLAALHAQNILHRNLTSAAVYLKGSVQRLVLRAALGDFEEAQIYGSLQNGALVSCTPTSTVVSKKYFFFPDIRAFALVALEILGIVCKRRQEEKQPHRLISMSRSKSLTDAMDPGPAEAGFTAGRNPGGLKKEVCKVASSHKKGPAPRHPSQLGEKGGGEGRICVVGTSTSSMMRGSRQDLLDGSLEDSVIPPLGPFKSEYMEVDVFGPHRHHHYDDSDGDDSGMSLSGEGERGGYFHHNHHALQQEEEAEAGTPRHPLITHVREAYRFEFPNQSVFRAHTTDEDASNDDASNDYEEIDDIEEEIHREIRFNALNRRRMNQTGGYIVTRTTSGRELFLPHNMNMQQPQQHTSHNTSYANSDSGYVGTSSNASSRYPYSLSAGEGGMGGGVDDPPDATPSWPKAAHRTTSAQTISSFGDDVLEVLPGMADEDDLRQGDRSLRQLLRARGDAKVEQILQDYEHRVRTGGFRSAEKEWPKLRFSRSMQGAILEGGKGASRPSTPRGATSTPRGSQPKEELASPRPRTATSGGPSSSATEGGTGTARADKARPLSASASAATGAWKLRNSFKKSKARNELTRVLGRGNGVARPGTSKQLQRSKSAVREHRGHGGKLVEQKYAAHNAALRNDAVEDERVAASVDDDDEEEEVEMLDELGDGGCEGQSCAATSVVSPRRSKSEDRVQLQSEMGLNGVDNEPCLTTGKQQHPVHEHSQPKPNAQDHHHHHHNNNNDLQLGKFSSFGSSDSMVSYDHRHQGHHHQRDTSLTSGELTSLSSQADSSRDIPLRTQDVSDSRDKDDAGVDSRGESRDGKPIVVPGMKIVDSGFDEDSASVVSDVSYKDETLDATAALPHHASSAETCTCSCGSETMTGSRSCACTCTCSSCRYGHSAGRHSESQESSEGTWSNSNSFSSYDVQMHRRKLPSGKGATEDHVLGPDEQYPSSHKPQRTSSAKPRHHRKHRHHHPCSHSHTCSSSSNTSSRSRGSSSVASRRYRELTKKGVPLRVSRVDETDSPRRDRLTSGKLSWRSTGGAEEVEVIEEEDDALYQDLESKGFFDSTDSASSKSSPTRQNPNSKMRPLPSASRRLEMVQGLQSGGGGGHSQHKLEMGHFPELPPMPSLEDIIREIPDETSEGLNGVEAKAFLNRPESELSVKALKPPSPEPPADLKDVETSDGQHRKPKLPREAEMGVDRMFSRQLHLQLGSGAGANAGRAGVSEGKQFTMDTGLRLNEAAVRQLALLPTITEIVYKDQTRNIHGGEGPLLLRGTDSKHVRYVESLSDKVGDLLYAEELLPADAKSFDKIRRRLQHTGNFGAIGVQLLDIIGACWLKDTPPSTADIVDQLTDHVTETEL